MAFTDHSDLFGSAHEEGINRVVRHVMRQRPSLFNYATPFFHQRPELLCVKIEPAAKVREAGNPTFTEMEPLPILGARMRVGRNLVPLTLNFCLQVTDAEIDLHPGGVFALPPELGRIEKQRFALRGRACAGIDCPPDDLIDELLPAIEANLVAQQEPAAGEIEREREEGGFSLIEILFPPLPTRRLVCFCLELFAVGHFEWGPVAGSEQRWLKPRVDGVEIVDLAPEAMEHALECYLLTVLKLGILPRLMVPMEKMILDITALLAEQSLEIGQRVTLGPAAVPGDVPANPAVEDDRIKAFINLTVIEGGA